MTPRSPAPTPFDLSGPLPSGTTVLEASAGTGKTFAIAGLVTRYVAAGVCRLPQMLVVTFTRAATAELRDRVRRRLVEGVGHLEDWRAGTASPSRDPVLSCLEDDDPTVVDRRLGNLATALAEFDAATISTIHGFCQHVLTGLGLAGDVDRDAELTEHTGDLIEAVVDDLLVATFHDRANGNGEAAGLTVSRRDLVAVAEKVVGNPDAVIVPSPDAEDRVAALRARLAGRIRREVDRRKRARGLLSYDDLLTRLAATLEDPDRGASARRTLRSRYRIALIDEFQDTDPIQWRILARAFGDGPAGSGEDGARPSDGDGDSDSEGDEHRALVLIGDPKQAIYSFRGADVYAYLTAAGAAATPQSMGTNWRSDAPLLQAFDVLFDGARFGDDRIRYQPVAAAPDHRQARLDGVPDPAALRVRVVRRDGDVRTQNNGRHIIAPAAREHIATDLTHEIIDLLESGATLPDAGDGRHRPVEPRDVAVLARTNAEASLVQRSLLDADVPAIINGVGSVFATPAASDWRRLLDALERPSHPGRTRAVALTAFVGWTGERVLEASDRQWDELHARLHAWSEILRTRGVASLLRTISVQEGLAGRLLARPDGERVLTDIEHLGELLHTAVAAEGLGPTSLAAWLREQIADVEDIAPEEQARRLESDAEAVQILTIHRSKGLEFPIVFCPFLWSGGGGWDAAPVFHDRERSNRRVVEVGGMWGADGSRREPFKEHRKLADREQAGEALRLLYVALTRARHQAVVWWAPVQGCDGSPLARMLFCRHDGGPVKRCDKASPPSDDDTIERIDALVARAGGTMSVCATPPRDDAPTWAGRRHGATELDVARFDRTLDTTWRRTSYSGLTAVVHERSLGPATPVGSEPDEPGLDDEAPIDGVAISGGEGVATAGGVGGVTAEAGDAASDVVATDDDPQRLRDVELPLADMPGGTEVGTFVHAVLEHADFTAQDLHAELTEQVDLQRTRRGVGIGDPAAVVAGLEAALATPLGPVADGLALRDVTPTMRLDELAFELPLPGATEPAAAGWSGDQGGDRVGPAAVTVAAIGRLLGEHLPGDDPLAGYPAALTDPSFHAAARGYLTGSIDVVLRLPGGEGDDRWMVADYKTNWLAPRHEPLSAWHYRPAALADAMVHGHYPLQALLYQVALHRYLRWRLPGYTPERHLGGALYLFVRGMTGETVPVVDGRPCGVFAWSPPASLVTGVSDLLDTGEASR